MTRHKQQLLQEQESLLEQIQKRNSTDTNEEICSPEEQNNSNNSNNDSSNTSENKLKVRRSPRNSPNKEPTKSNENSPDKIRTPDKEISHSSVNMSQPNSIMRLHTTTDTRNNLPQSRLIAMLQDNQQQQNKQTKQENHFNFDQRKHTLEDDVKVLDNSVFGRYLVSTQLISNMYVGVKVIYAPADLRQLHL